MVKSKPLREEALTLFLTQRLSRQKSNTLFDYCFCTFRRYTKRKLSKARSALAFTGNQAEGGAGPALSPAGWGWHLQRDSHTGGCQRCQANPYPLWILWNPCGFLMPWHIQGIFTWKKYQKTPNLAISPFWIKNIPSIFVVCYYLFSILFFFPHKLQPRKGTPCKSDASSFPCTCSGYSPTWRYPNPSLVQ